MVSLSPYRSGGRVLSFALLMTGLMSSGLFAQIRDDESSADYLAAQCAISSGGDASNYEVYCRRLAKTVALLSSSQQERVFGFVPQPISFARPEDGVNSNQGTEFGGAAPQETYNPGGDGFNLGGSQGSTGSGTSGVAGESDPSENSTEPSGEPEPTPEPDAEPDPTSNWWEDALLWLGEWIDSVIAELAEHQEA